MRAGRSRVGGALLFALTLGASEAAGCSALFSKSEPLSVRYYSPPARDASSDARSRAAAAALPPLRLGRVAGAAHLDVHMVHRKGDNEIVYDEALRWSEMPSRYLQRALSRALFEERGLREAMSGQAMTLEAELLAFEAISAPSLKARVSVAFTLHDERTSHLVETVTIDRDLSGSGPEVLVASLAAALDDCVDRILGRVIPALTQSAKPPAQSEP